MQVLWHRKNDKDHKGDKNFLKLLKLKKKIGKFLKKYLLKFGEIEENILVNLLKAFITFTFISM